MKADDRVNETTTSFGTGNIALLGAVAQHITFATNFAINERFDYAIVGQTGTEWEVGRGYLSGATTLIRDVVIRSSNAGALVNFSAGTKNVFCDLSSERLNALIGHAIAMSQGTYLR